MVDNDLTWLDTSKKISYSRLKKGQPVSFFRITRFSQTCPFLQHLEYGTNDTEAWIDKVADDRQAGNVDKAQAAPVLIGRAATTFGYFTCPFEPSLTLLLMDEPFSALDQDTKYALINAISKCIVPLRFGTTVLIVSHNPGEFALNCLGLNC